MSAASDVRRKCLFPVNKSFLPSQLIFKFNKIYLIKKNLILAFAARQSSLIYTAVKTISLPKDV